MSSTPSQPAADAQAEVDRLSDELAANHARLMGRAAADKATPRPWRATAVRHNRGGEQYIEIEHSTGPRSATMICSISSVYLNVDELTDEDRANAELIVRSVNASAAVEGLERALRRLVNAYDISRDMYWRTMNLPRPNDDDTGPIAEARAALAAVEQLKGDA